MTVFFQTILKLWARTTLFLFFDDIRDPNLMCKVCMSLFTDSEPSQSGGRHVHGCGLCPLPKYFFGKSYFVGQSICRIFSSFFLPLPPLSYY